MLEAKIFRSICFALDGDARERVSVKRSLANTGERQRRAFDAALAAFVSKEA